MRQHTPPLMLFAAGFGTRMGALTANQPKPLIRVGGMPLIDRALAMVDAAGITKTVVNLHYRGDQLAAHLQGRNVALSWERDEILETGGGMKAALPLLGDGPVLALNPDAVWTGENPLTRLMAEWDGDRMDCLVTLLPAAYLGAQMVNPDLLADIPDRAFSLNRLWDMAIARGRAFGLIHRGGWCDVGTPEGIGQAEALLAGIAHA